MNFGVKLRELRLEEGLSQGEIANIIGISRVQYNQYENDYFNVPIKYLIKLSDYYKVTIDYILGLSVIRNYQNGYKNVDNLIAGERLKEFRKEKKLTQSKLANILNTTFSTIGFYEKGRNLIATPFLYTVCQKYNISADYLLGKTDSPKYLK